MSLNDTPSSERIRISFFGRRNAGKSSVINAVTGQPVSIVSDVRGTTTDPVTKAMELLPLGPVLLTDTPGIDDEGELGRLRVERTLEVLARTDIAVLIADAAAGLTDTDRMLV
ncbi:MAG: 50S ribosome-binding GTPase, partial [Oscillospiraceae bacterium]|nr:50S ribosome-binding GTPase [Oscillospiraceae bacterium]